MMQVLRSKHAKYVLGNAHAEREERVGDAKASVKALIEVEASVESTAKYDGVESQSKGQRTDGPAYFSCHQTRVNPFRPIET